MTIEVHQIPAQANALQSTDELLVSDRLSANGTGWRTFTAILNALANYGGAVAPTDLIPVKTGSGTGWKSIASSIGSQQAALATPIFTLGVTGDASFRVRLTSSGVLEWADGTGAADTNLYRSAANALTTDDALYVSALTVQGDVGLGATGSPGRVGFSGSTLTHYTGDGTGWTWRVAYRTGGVTYPILSVVDSTRWLTVNGAAPSIPAVGETAIGGGRVYTKGQLAVFADDSTFAFRVQRNADDSLMFAAFTSGEWRWAASYDTTGAYYGMSWYTSDTKRMELAVDGKLKQFVGHVLPKTSGAGFQVDTTTPTFPWRDLEGILRPDPAGGSAPTLAVMIAGSVRQYAFGAGDKMDCLFHIPHDWLPGSDLFVHVHWLHNGTAISGNNVMTLAYSYAKGHNQANFATEKSQTITFNTVDIATTPRYRHRIDEIQLSDAGGTGNYLDTSAIEIDGVVVLNFTQTTIPTITGGSPNEPFVLCVDIHYQSTGIGSKQKSPDFYT